MKTPIALIIVLVVAVGAFIYFEDSLFPASPSDGVSQEQTTIDNPNADDTEVCIQVITPARNTETGEFNEFPTPCDVPEGWEVIQPEGLDFNLEAI